MEGVMDVWVKSRAVVVVVVMGKEEGDMQGMEHVKRAGLKVGKMEGQTFPVSAAQTAGMVATGTMPRVNGIVAETWMNDEGQRIHAGVVESLVPTLGDVLENAFEGQSLILTLSASEAAAKVFGPRSLFSSSRNNFAFGVKGNSIRSLSSAHSIDVAFDFEEVMRSPEVQVLLQDFQVDFSNGIMLNTADLDGVHFDLVTEADLTFFSEIFASVFLLKELKSDRSFAKFVGDDVPDLHAITLSGLEGIIREYGVNSKKYAMAARVIDAAMDYIVGQYMSLYANDVSVEMVITGSNRLNEKHLIQRIQELVPEQVAVLFPYVYVLPKYSEQDVYAKISDQLSPANAYFVKQDLTMLSASESIYPFVSASDATNSTITDADIQSYQICLWTSILLVAVLVLALYAMVDMSNKRGDAMLYSRFNPMWSDRKHR